MRKLIFLTLPILLVLSAGSASAQKPAEPEASNDNASSNAPPTGLATRETLSELFNIIACPKKGGPCSKTIDANGISIWLQWVGSRAPGRRGLLTLNFSDFQSLHARYGNALAKLIERPFPVLYDENFEGPREIPGKLWVLYETKDDSSPVLAGIVPPQYSNIIPQETSIAEFAAEFAKLMDPNGSGINKNQFTNFMLSRQ